MLKDFILGALEDIRTLIEVTSRDIDDIKNARHEELFKRNKLKEELVGSFENKKLLIDNEITKLTRKNPNKQVDEILEGEIKDLLSELQSSLLELKTINKNYARMVLGVSEFYNSLLDKLLPKESSGYKGVSPKASFIKLEV
ncbi:MAG: hypothetical protein ACLFQJ_10655 [Campylobacterales bacterium]